jgi:hypothetical protein
MGIGAGVLLIAIGAILAFAVDFDVSGVDISVIGWILMVAGAIGLILVVAVWGPRRRAASSQVVQERRVYDDPPL